MLFKPLIKKHHSRSTPLMYIQNIYLDRVKNSCNGDQKASKDQQKHSLSLQAITQPTNHFENGAKYNHSFQNPVVDYSIYDHSVKEIMADYLAFRKVYFIGNQADNLSVAQSSQRLKFVITSYIQADVQKTLHLLQLFFHKLTLFFCTRLTGHSKFGIVCSQKLISDKQAAKFKNLAANDRYLFKTIKLLNRRSIIKQSRALPQSGQIVTVIRSPHVFKKTREQFGLRVMTYTHTVGGLPKTTLKLILQYVMLLKLPAEVKIVLD